MAVCRMYCTCPAHSYFHGPYTTALILFGLGRSASSQADDVWVHVFVHRLNDVLYPAERALLRNNIFSRDPDFYQRDQ